MNKTEFKAEIHRVKRDGRIIGCGRIAREIFVSKSLVTRILNGDYNYKSEEDWLRDFIAANHVTRMITLACTMPLCIVKIGRAHV